MKKKLLIIGFGSSGRKFANIAKKKFKKLEVFILTRQKKIGFNTIKKFQILKVLTLNLLLFVHQLHYILTN